MAKKKAGVNKSKAIKEALAAHAATSSGEIVDLLAAKGITVTSTYVANVKSTLKKSKGRRKGKKEAAAKGASDTVSLSTLMQAKKLAEDLGGVEKARVALAALAKLGL